MLAVYGPRSFFWQKAKKQFFWSNLVFFTIKTRFWQYYSEFIMRKLQFNDEFLVLLGPIIGRLFTYSNEEKRVLVLSLWAESTNTLAYICQDVNDREKSWKVNIIFCIQEFRNWRVSILGRGDSTRKTLFVFVVTSAKP
jgi:hypothetical protein